MGVRISVGVLVMSGILSACSSGDATAKTDADKADERPFETPLPLNTQPKRLALDGYSHTVGVKADGTVWVWGSSRDGEMGLGKEVDGHAQPVQIPGLTDVVEVAGGNHILALRKDGTVWSWGQNKYGQLGYETEKPFSATPKQVPGLKDIVSVAAGSQHSLALSRGGFVHAFGANNRHQIGHNESSRNSHEIPSAAYNDERVVKIVAYADTSAVITSSGRVYAWGVDESRQFSSKNDNFITEIVEIKLPENVSNFFVGVNNYYVLSENGSVWSIGSNFNGALGQGSRDPATGWHRVKNIDRIVGLASAGVSAIAIDNLGNVYQWGENVRWKPELSVRKINIESVPVRVSGNYPRSIVYSGMRNAILSEDGSVYFWGWDNGARARPINVKKLSGDDSWFFPEKSSWRWK